MSPACCWRAGPAASGDRGWRSAPVVSRDSSAAGREPDARVGEAGIAVGRLLTLARSLLPDRYLFLSFNLDFGLDWRVLTFAIVVTTATVCCSASCRSRRRERISCRR